MTTVRLVLAPLLVGVLAAATCTVLAVEARAAAGPAVAKCGNLKTKAAKQRCAKQNQANRAAFVQIKNSRFAGSRGDGQEIDAVFCANGKFESRATDSSGTGVSSGRSWRVVDAVVRQNGKFVNAFLTDGDGFEVGIQRRGATWKLGVASLGRILDAGKMTKTPAAADCAKLDV